MKARVLFLIGLLGCTVAAQSSNPLQLATAAVPDGARRIAYGHALIRSVSNPQ